MRRVLVPLLFCVLILASVVVTVVVVVLLGCLVGIE